MGQEDKWKLRDDYRELLLDGGKKCRHIHVGRFLEGEIKVQEKSALEFYSIIFSEKLFAFLQSRRLGTCDFFTLLLRDEPHKING